MAQECPGCPSSVASTLVPQTHALLPAVWWQVARLDTDCITGRVAGNSVVAERSQDLRSSLGALVKSGVAGRGSVRSYPVGNCRVFVRAPACEETKDSNTASSEVLGHWRNRTTMKGLLTEVAKQADGSEETMEVVWRNGRGRWRGSMRWKVQHRQEMEVANLWVLVTMAPDLTQVLVYQKKHQEAVVTFLVRPAEHWSHRV